MAPMIGLAIIFGSFSFFYIVNLILRLRRRQNVRFLVAPIALFTLACVIIISSVIRSSITQTEWVTYDALALGISNAIGMFTIWFYPIRRGFLFWDPGKPQRCKKSRYEIVSDVFAMIAMLMAAFGPLFIVICTLLIFRN